MKPESLLVRARLRAGLTQEELADRSGLSVRNISNLERGRISRPHMESLERLVRALDLDTNERREFIDHYRHGKPAATTPPCAAPNQLPTRPARFTGRSEYLTWLDEQARLGAGAAPILVVDGIGGVGKTALVIEWSRRARELFPDGQLFADLHGYGPTTPADPSVVLGSLLRTLGVSGEQVPADRDTRAVLFRSCLADRRVLLVLDNVRTADQVRPLLPASDGCMVVVTSRHQLRGLCARDGARRITLRPFDDTEATALLRRLIGEDRMAGEPAAVADIVRSCAGLPLAVNIVGERVAREPDCSLGGLAGDLSDTSARLDLLDTGDDQDSDVRAICSWSYDALEPAAARLFRLLALFPGAAFRRAAAAALGGVDDPAAARLLDALTGCHLLEQSSSGRWEFHDLLHAYADELTRRLDSAQARRAALARLLDHYVRSAGRAAVALRHDDRPAAEEGFADAAEALAWLDDERQNLLAAAIAATRHDMASHAGELSRGLWNYLDSEAHYQDAQTLHSHAARTADVAARGEALRYLGIACDRMGQHEAALTHYQAALDLVRQIGDRISENRVLNNMGIVYHRLGRNRSAEDHYRQVLAISEDVGDVSTKARALGNLGLIYETLGEYSRAFDHHQEAMELARAAGDKLIETNQRDNLGTACRLLGRHGDALDHHRGALAGYRRIGNRSGESDALSNIGVAYQTLERYADARDHYQQALDIARAIGNPVAEAKAHNGLGETDLLDGRPAPAARHHRSAIRALAGRAPTPESARAHSGLARASTALGDLDTARAQWQESLTHHRHLHTAEVDTIRAQLDALDRRSVVGHGDTR